MTDNFSYLSNELKKIKTGFKTQHGELGIKKNKAATNPSFKQQYSTPKAEAAIR